MPIFDLNGAKPAFPKPEKRAQKRTMTPQSLAGALSGGAISGSGIGFAAAEMNRLLKDFLARSRSADQDLFSDNRILRARARKLALDNPFARKFLAMGVQNVIGPAGILLQAKVVNKDGNETAATKEINRRIEEEWNIWGEVGSCTVDGKCSFLEVQQMVLKNCAREGENLAKGVLGRQFNPTGFALQLLDNDQLDDTMVLAMDNGGEIRMGVEVDMYRRPQAYWLFTGHPNDPHVGRDRNRERIRVPAKEIIHTAIWERPGQTRGYTWMASSILSMNMYGGYEEAVTVAARTAAAKFAVIESTLPEGWSPDDEDLAGNDRNSDGTAMMSANSGELMALEPGETINFIDPKFPTTTHREFTQTIVRNIASGLLVSYPSLANDLEGVNFSSIRAGLLDERDSWRVIQRWFIDHFMKPVFYAWLDMALLTTLQDIVLTPAQRRQFAWKARGWDWVDPMKDAQAEVLKLGNGLTTYTDSLAKIGLDFEEMMRQRAKEQKFIKDLGLNMGTDLSGDQSGKGVAAGETASEPAEGDGKPAAKPAGGKEK